MNSERLAHRRKCEDYEARIARLEGSARDSLKNEGLQEVAVRYI
jgi:hypothetical protein